MWHTQAGLGLSPLCVSCAQLEAWSRADISETLEDLKHLTQDVVILKTMGSCGGGLHREITWLDIWT